MFVNLELKQLKKKLTKKTPLMSWPQKKKWQWFRLVMRMSKHLKVKKNRLQRPPIKRNQLSNKEHSA